MSFSNTSVSCTVNLFENSMTAKKTKPQPKEPILCHVHEYIKSSDSEHSVHEDVCQDLKFKTKQHTDGKYYCFLHLPDEDKDSDEFKKIINQRFEDVAASVGKVVLPFSENDNKTGKMNCFKYVWFPDGFRFSNKIFIGEVDFSSAFFSGDVMFIRAVFEGTAYFTSAIFKGFANFNCTTFEGYADFDSVEFLKNVDFNGKTFFRSHTKFDETAFSGSADFSSATFIRNTTFKKTTFGGRADFSSTTFNETSETNFIETRFSGDADFSSAMFNGEVEFNKTKFGKTGETKFFKAKFDNDVIFEKTEFNNPVSFNSAVFGKESDIIFRDAFFAQYASFRYSTSEGYLRFINLRQGEENRFNFEEAAFEKASRISFNKVRLRPNWFINIDSRKFSFTNINWENHKASNKELTDELESLEKRNHKEPDNFRLLIIAFRNLATNAEEFNRLEDASNFRESAFECEKLERKQEQKDWLNNVSKTLDKKFICWDFFSETKTITNELWKLIKNAPFDLVHFLYRLLSFYGESWFRAAWILVSVWFLFGYAYFSFGEFGTNGNEFIKFGKSLAYSLSVMTLQKPEPRPFSSITYILYGLETILAPLQAALLALAIRRKFMR